MASTHVVVDGSNIATEGRTLPSLQQLDEAVRAFMAERPHDICTVVVDATFEHRIDASEKAMYDEALAANELLTPPAGSIGRGDKFILEIADRVDATVFSNDSFQEFHGEYDWLFVPGRLVGGKPVPGVGWVFVERTPVRGPKSRMATRAASKKRTRGAAGASAKKAARSSPARSGVELGPAPVPSSPPPRKRTAKSSRPPTAASPSAEQSAAAAEPSLSSRAGGEPLNAPLPFIEFVAEKQPGSTVTGTVTEFSSHGAYVDVDGVRCYAPLRLLGTPPPRSAREVLARGEVREFVVAAIHAARRGIDLGLPGIEIAGVTGKATTKRPSSRRRSRTGTTVTEASTDAVTDADQVPAAAGTDQPESEATLAPTRKAAAKKAPAKKATARKASARKAPARKAPAKRATAKKTTAKKATARKSTARKAPARKAAAKKTTARKAPAKKATARKAPARKATAKKTTARKATAKKTTARKATAKKTTARKATAKKATARKATAKKAPARKATAKKATARKAPARKAPARKATARKTAARKAPARKTAAKRTTARKR